MSIPTLPAGRQYAYVEITRSEHQHGGPGWEFGRCLWSPTRNRAGADRYSLMRDPRKGDLVIHFYDTDWPDGRSDTRLCGFSWVASPVSERGDEPPAPGQWGGMGRYYRIELRDYTAVTSPLPLSTLIADYGDEIAAELQEDAPGFYPFNLRKDGLRTVQGIYLARATSRLIAVFNRALGVEAEGAESGDLGEDRHGEFREARRMARERYFFSRNARLVRLAKERYGSTCQV